MGVKVGLENISELCKRLGNPQASLRIIHIAGTNGKGSTASFCAHLLKNKRKKVGLFTSPHLLSPRERIRLDGDPISEADFTKYLLEIESISKDIEPTYFEVLTALALSWYASQELDWVVLETGLGGRLDSTNVVNAEIVAITSIALEHTEFLGDTHEVILKEKCGIIKENSKVWEGLDSLELSYLAKCYAKEKNAVYMGNVKDSSYAWILNENLGYMGRNYALASSMVSSILDLEFSKQELLELMASHTWTGRFQSLFYGAQLWLLDGAHNEHAMIELVKQVKIKYPNIKFNVLIAMAEDKDVAKSIIPLFDIAESFVLPQPRIQRILDNKKLAQVILDFNKNSQTVVYSSVLDALKDMAQQKKPVLVCGSLYLMGEVIEGLCHDVEDLAWYRQFKLSSNERAPLKIL